jgi:hypothetical protein
MVHKFVTRPIYNTPDGVLPDGTIIDYKVAQGGGPPVYLKEVPLDKQRRHCTRCNCTHGYWTGGSCIICANHRISGLKSRFGKYGKVMPDYSDRNTAEQA